MQIYSYILKKNFFKKGYLKKKKKSGGTYPKVGTQEFHFY